jgi:hypothetical protein
VANVAGSTETPSAQQPWCEGGEEVDDLEVDDLEWPNRRRWDDGLARWCQLEQRSGTVWMAIFTRSATRRKQLELCLGVERIREHQRTWGIAWSEQCPVGHAVWR